MVFPSTRSAVVRTSSLVKGKTNNLPELPINDNLDLFLSVQGYHCIPLSHLLLFKDSWRYRYRVTYNAMY